MSEGEGEYAEGEYAEGEYAEGEYAEGEYAEGEYGEGEYSEGEYTEGGNGGEVKTNVDDEEDNEKSDVGWVSARDIKGPPRKAPPKRPEDLEKEIEERKETWSKRYDLNRNWDEEVGDAVFIDEGNNKEVSIDDFQLNGTPIEENYQNFSNIGRGTFSIVKRAKSKKSGKEVAIKIVNENLAPELTTKDLLSQIEIIKQLDHPNIVKYVESYEIKGTVCYVFDLLKGGEVLKKFASNKNGNWNEAIVQRIIKQTLSALDYLHNKNIIHLHVNHENILLKEDSEESDVVLGGFNLSRKEGDTNSVKGGNVDYQSPEILQQNSVNAKSDMWSLGVLTLLFLSGKLPFHDNNRMKRNLKISKGTYTVDPSLSQNAKNFVSSLLVVDQNSRLSSNDALKHEFITSTASNTNISNVRALFSSIN